MIEIDGSFGEGGGQILRTSLALSLVTQQPFRISNIRLRRAKPGLRRQHLTAVRAAALIGNAALEGDRLNSAEITFAPGRIRGGEYKFDIGTGGSTTLVFQTVLPALLGAAQPSRMTFIGGTHNRGGPPWHFLDEVYLPVLRRMGARVAIQLERYGFAQGGQGRWTAKIEPSALKPIAIHERGEQMGSIARAIVANLPVSIAEREIAIVGSGKAEVVEAAGPGNIVLISGRFRHIAEMATGFGQRGVPAEMVAQHALDCWRTYEAGIAPVGEYLADQLLLPLALAGGGSFTTMKPTLHTLTNANTIVRFMRDADVRIAPARKSTYTIECHCGGAAGK